MVQAGFCQMLFVVRRSELKDDADVVGNWAISLVREEAFCLCGKAVSG